MYESMNDLIAAYFENYRVLNAVFKLDSGVNYAACANLLCSRGVIADADALTQCRSLLKAKEGFFSTFRASAEMFTCTSMYLSGEPEAKLFRVQQNYQLLKKLYIDSSHLVTASFMLDDTCAPDQIPAVAERSRVLYKKMQKLHPLLTGTEDAPYCVMLARSPKTDDELIAEMEKIYAGIRKFATDNAAQTISHLYTLSDEPAEEKCAGLLSLYQALEQGGRKYAKDLRLTVLAALTLPNLDPAGVAADILQADSILAQQQEYSGLLGEDSQNRLMHAAMIVSTMQAPHYAIAEYASVNAAIYIAIIIAVCAASSAVMVTAATS